MKKDHQGKYHLLSILLIPGFLVSLFLSNHWLIPILFLLISSLIVFLTFYKKKPQ